MIWNELIHDNERNGVYVIFGVDTESVEKLKVLDGWIIYGLRTLKLSIKDSNKNTISIVDSESNKSSESVSEPDELNNTTIRKVENKSTPKVSSNPFSQTKINTVNIKESILNSTVKTLVEENIATTQINTDELLETTKSQQLMNIT